LEYFTIVWNCLEGLIAVSAGVFAGSISLVGFGVDSFIEVTSGSALLWRMSMDADAHRREHFERRALRIVGGCFLALAAYVAYEAVRDLIAQQAAAHSGPGILLACVSLVVMPLLSRAKRRVGSAMHSRAMSRRPADRVLCTCQPFCSAGCHQHPVGLRWADLIAALAMVPIIVKEGIHGLRGDACCAWHWTEVDSQGRACGESKPRDFRLLQSQAPHKLVLRDFNKRRYDHCCQQQHELPTGGTVKPRIGASGVTGSTAPIPTMTRVVIVSGRLGRLRSGLPIVRITNSTNVCVASDSTNHPVWNKARLAWKILSMA
jgi:hypothetical protein